MTKHRLAAAVAALVLVLVGLVGSAAPAGAEPNDEGNSWLIAVIEDAQVRIGHG